MSVTGKERFFKEDEIIVSKTNLKGHLTYANRVFIDISGFTEPELLGEPHSILRHPDMPRCVFKLLWDTIKDKKEIFAYVINRCKNGDHYWVLAHVTPSISAAGEVDGYHSNRRVPDPKIVKSAIVPLYQALLEEEKRHSNAKEGMNAGFDMLAGILKEKGLGYDEFIFSLKN
ncbi:MAG: PAS domain-containing protein [Alphaproteobacteria bacterium]|nr:PAS domain-containing protein [Alphaproteobacteria bacterium]